MVLKVLVKIGMKLVIPLAGSYKLITFKASRILEQGPTIILR